MSTVTPPLRPVVYVMGDERLVKIGTSTRVWQRLATIRGHCGYPIELLAHFDGSVGTERWCHARFAEHGTHGEWFLREGALATWVTTLRDLKQRGVLTRAAALHAAGAVIRDGTLVAPPRASAFDPGPWHSRGIMTLEARRAARKL